MVQETVDGGAAPDGETPGPVLDKLAEDIAGLINHGLSDDEIAYRIAYERGKGRVDKPELLVGVIRKLMTRSAGENEAESDDPWGETLRVIPTVEDKEPPLGLGRIDEPSLHQQRAQEADYQLQEYDFYSEGWYFEDSDGFESITSCGKEDPPQCRVWQKTVYLQKLGEDGAPIDPDMPTEAHRFIIRFQEGTSDVEEITVTRK